MIELNQNSADEDMFWMFNSTWTDPKKAEDILLSDPDIASCLDPGSYGPISSQTSSKVLSGFGLQQAEAIKDRAEMMAVFHPQVAEFDLSGASHTVCCSFPGSSIVGMVLVSGKACASSLALKLYRGSKIRRRLGKENMLDAFSAMRDSSRSWVQFGKMGMGSFFGFPFSKIPKPPISHSMLGRLRSDFVERFIGSPRAPEVMIMEDCSPNSVIVDSGTVKPKVFDLSPIPFEVISSISIIDDLEDCYSAEEVDEDHVETPFLHSCTKVQSQLSAKKMPRSCLDSPVRVRRSPRLNKFIF